jgi:hypothetical protein
MELLDKYLEWWPVHQAEIILFNEAAARQRHITAGRFVICTTLGTFGILAPRDD